MLCQFSDFGLCKRIRSLSGTQRLKSKSILLKILMEGGGKFPTYVFLSYLMLLSWFFKQNQNPVSELPALGQGVIIMLFL